MLEKDIETYLRKRVEKELDGLFLKWISPGAAGVPDRILIYQGGVLFVELKKTGGRLRECQKIRQAKITRAGGTVRTVTGKEEADKLIEELKGGDAL